MRSQRYLKPLQLLVDYDENGAEHNQMNFSDSQRKFSNDSLKPLRLYIEICETKISDGEVRSKFKPVHLYLEEHTQKELNSTGENVHECNQLHISEEGLTKTNAKVDINNESNDFSENVQNESNKHIIDSTAHGIGGEQFCDLSKKNSKKVSSENSKIQAYENKNNGMFSEQTCDQISSNSEDDFTALLAASYLQERNSGVTNEEIRHIGHSGEPIG